MKCYKNMEASEKMIEFVRSHAKDDVNTLRLKYAGKKTTALDFSLDFALIQIEARRKANKKLPSFISNPFFLFPDCISSEQATNECIAKFHATLLSSCKSILDITAGLGIDDLTFAMSGIHVTACEIDTQKSEALKHNAEILEVSENIEVINQDSIEYLRSCNRRFDAVFSDPARRSSSGKRLHALSDCSPDILEALPSIMNISERLLVKSSPLLDISLILNSISQLSHIFVVCFKGECKEVLIDIQNQRSFSGITVIDLDSEGVISKFHTSGLVNFESEAVKFADRKSASDYKYLYEPNAGVMKTGSWSTLSSLYPELYKADRNTHIFLSDALYEGFPGRIMTISSQPDKKGLKGLKGSKINVVARNYPMATSEVAKKYSIITGTDRFLYAFRYLGNPTIITGESFTKGQPTQE